MYISCNKPQYHTTGKSLCSFQCSWWYNCHYHFLSPGTGSSWLWEWMNRWHTFLSSSFRIGPFPPYRMQCQSHPHPPTPLLPFRNSVLESSIYSHKLFYWAFGDGLSTKRMLCTFLQHPAGWIDTPVNKDRANYSVPLPSCHNPTTLPISSACQPGAGLPSLPQLCLTTWIIMKDQPHTNALKTQKHR